MTPDEKASLEILIARNAESVKAESRKIADAKRQEKELFVLSLLQQTDFDVNKIATLAGVSVDVVLAAKRQLSAK